MYPHRIRLRGPWECEPLTRLPQGEPGSVPPLPPPLRMTLPCRWADGGLRDFTGRVRFRRRFGYPGRIDADERVWLTFTGVEGQAAVTLNGTFLELGAATGSFEYEMTALLQNRNELVVDLEGSAERGGLTGEVALEVRRTAFLRDVRVWLVSQPGGGVELHATGSVVGTATEALDLYVILGRFTAAQSVARPLPEGQPFHLTAVDVIPDPMAKVDLVGGATVWYTAECSVAMHGPHEGAATRE